MRKSFLALIAIFALPMAAQSQNGRILSTTTLDVYECNIDASNCFIVAGHGDNGVSSEPSVASDGTIAFQGYYVADPLLDGNRHIFLMNPDGTSPRQITHNPPGLPPGYNGELWPTISPDGTKVAFLSTINGAPDGSRPQEIYVVNRDGSNQRQVTPFLAITASNPPDYSQSSMFGMAWSPDSTRLAFRGTVYTSQCGTYFGNPIIVNVIGTINADGTNMQFLSCDNGDGYVTSIDWSTDGTLLAWGRNVNHGAQGCSGCVGEPAIAFLDLSGQNRYPSGITSSQLGTDSCQSGPRCIHFSPQGTQLAYQNQYGQVSCGGISCVSLINVDGSGQTNTTMQYANGLWWMPGGAIPAPAQMTLAGSSPNVPPDPVEIWPGFPQQLIPTMSDSHSNLILHTAASYTIGDGQPGLNTCLNIGPYGLAFYVNTGGSGYNEYDNVTAANAGLTSNRITVKCWPSPPCTFSLGATSTELPAGGGTGMVAVSANSGANQSTCPWTSTTSASWISITSGTSSSGNGSVNFNVAANSGAARQATITIAGLTYTVNQDAVPQLAIGKTHTGNFAQGQTGATYVVTVGNTGAGPTSGIVTVTETAPSGLTFTALSGTGWTCSLGSSSCQRSDVLLPNASYPAVTVTVNVAVNAPSSLTNSATVSGGGDPNSHTANDPTMINPLPDLTITKMHAGSFTQGQTGATYTLTVSNVGGASSNGTVTVTDTLPSGLLATAFAGTGWTCTLSPLSCQRSDALGAGGSYPTIALTVNVANDAAPSLTNTTTVSGGGDVTPGDNTANDVTSISAVALRFVAVTPCRIMDTRTDSGFSGAFGQPFLSGNTTRTIPIPTSPCAMPSTAKSYSLNATVVPHSTLGWLTLWPTGETQPLVSTLNALDGQITANAAIVPAGVNGSINAYVTDDTDLILDINGYFLATTTSGLEFFPLTPCRVLDTRNTAGPLGGPILSGNTTRTFPILSSTCGIPATAQAYVFNATVVPPGELDYLTLWPTGVAQPTVSTLNALDGVITANMAIVPVGTGGSITAFVKQDSHLVLDITGYFAPPGTGGLQFYTLTPCRFVDTRNPNDTFGGPTMMSGSTRSFPVPTSSCSVPTTAQGYSMNATVVPPGPLGWLTVWPTGLPEPLASTLNAPDGAITANALIVPAGTGGAINAFVTDTTHLIFDINGYFAP